jgi:hypothetical protein
MLWATTTLKEPRKGVCIIDIDLQVFDEKVSFCIWIPEWKFFYKEFCTFGVWLYSYYVRLCPLF